jgi:hypothetical protein
MWVRIRIHLIPLVRIRILPFNLVQIHADLDPQRWHKGSMDHNSPTYVQ